MRIPNSQRIFGPVPSRRLGSSLGIDVIPHKTCTFDCVYCECGATTDKTCERREFYPLLELLEELESHLFQMEEKPDVVTLSGSGEPTLYSPLGELIEGIKRIAGLPVAVITNSSLLWMPDVRDELSRADIVLPSLDAATRDAFGRINRPHERCNLTRIIEGLERFLEEYRGTALLEILLIEGYNTDAANLEALKTAIARMRVDRIQLNTALRPGTEKRIEPMDAASMEQIRDFFGPRCEIIASAKTTRMRHEERILVGIVMPMLDRRPCTAEDIGAVLGIAPVEIIKLMNGLKEAGKVTERSHGGVVFYSSASGKKD
jgi:wyosine [tRNA(Phe)-imidazoG37] synthetase (radical SAM superfamily)